MSEDVETKDTTINQLRHELKVWEKEFAAANGGRKAGREDIKKDATISAKYREYDRLTRKPAKLDSTPQRTRRSDIPPREDAVLRDIPPNLTTATPRRSSSHTKGLLPPEASDGEENGPTPAIVRCALGPTPQKDGEILSIFDMLPDGTPSKGADIITTAPDAMIAATPSKTTKLQSSEPKLSKTPQSSAKRMFLEAFAATPLKRKRDEESRYTPSTAKRQYATPAFLRRSFTLSRIDEESAEASATAPAFKKRGLVRSLSTIIQGLKKQEEERMEDEWEIMNEIEAEERGEPKRSSVPKVLLEDSQAVEMPLGPDQGAQFDDGSDGDDPGALDANGRPRKVWKKKGLKRQTRRVIMRPVKHKPGKAVAKSNPDLEDDSDGVKETQIQDKQLQSVQPAGAEEGAEVTEAEDSDYEHDSQRSPRESNKPRSKKSDKTKAAVQKIASAEDDAASKKTKRVNPQSHANFRKLKIKNKNSKAKGRGGRFGRR